MILLLFVLFVVLISLPLFIITTVPFLIIVYTLIFAPSPRR